MARSRYPRVFGSAGAKAQSRGVFVATGGVTPPPIPTLTLSVPAPSIASNAVAGALVSNISNVPTGATPTVTPNDGRLVIAGDASAGWKVVVGMSALSAGTVNFSVAATGATGASGVLTVTSAIVPLSTQTGSGTALVPVQGRDLTLVSGNLPAGRRIQGEAVRGNRTASGVYNYTLRSTAITGETTDTSYTETVAWAPLIFDGLVPIFDWDKVNDKVFYKGVTYQSLAEFKAALPALGDSWTDSGAGGFLESSTDLVGSEYNIRVHGITPPTAVEETLVVLDNAAVANQNTSLRIGSTGFALGRNFSGSTVTTVQTAATVGVNTEFAASAAYKASGFNVAISGSDPRFTNTGNLASGKRRFAVGTSNTLTATISRATLYPSVLNGGKQSAMSITDFNGRTMRNAGTGYLGNYAVRSGDYSYIGGNYKSGPWVARIRNDTGQITSYFRLATNYSQYDDHNNPALLITATGALLIMYTGHSVDSAVRFRRSTLPDFAFSAEVAVTTAAIGTAAYSQLRTHASTGHIYAFSRISDTAWGFLKSTDDGVTWSAPRTLVRRSGSVKLYGRFGWSGTDTLFMNFGGRVFEWNVVTGDITDGSGAVTFNTTTNTDVTAGASWDAAPVFDAFNQVQDINETATVMILARQDAAHAFTYKYYSYKGSGGRLNFANWNTSELPLDPNNRGFSSGLDFDGSAMVSGEAGLAFPRVYTAARYPDGKARTLQFDATNAEGTSWNLTRIIGSASDANNFAVFRPKSPANADPNFAVYWQEGTYVDFDNWDLKIYW